MVKCTARDLVVKGPAVLSKVQMLNLVLGVRVFSLLPMSVRDAKTTILIRFAGLEGAGEGAKIRENCPKTLFLFGNSMTVNLEKFMNFVVGNLLSFRRLSIECGLT